ncbi:hypothetical protein [Thalassospira alkalitolerans]|nr:hypothetical protein [Thalassospira alkalitolerans]
MADQQNESVTATAVWGAGADAGTINELADGAPGCSAPFKLDRF